METLLQSFSLRFNNRCCVQKVRPHIDGPQQVLILKGQVLRVVPHIGSQIVGTTFDRVDLRRNTARVIDNHSQVAVFGNDGYAFQIHVFREFAVVFDSEYCTFLRIDTEVILT